MLHITNVTSLRLQIAMTIKDKENADPNVLQADVDSKKVSILYEISLLFVYNDRLMNVLT